jgi:NAD(P)H-hydrate epimerase
VDRIRRLDQAAIDAIGIPRLLLMDHAGLAVACAARKLAGRTPAYLLICCGSGYNGGDGLCAAWHLAQWGYRPSVVVVGSTRALRDEPAVFARILEAIPVGLHQLESIPQARALGARMRRASVIIDALLGVGLAGPVRPLYAHVIAAINRAKRPVVAVDVPSGLDADTGRVQGAAVKATLTVTFGLPKQGFFLHDGPAHVGRLIVEHIGLPRRLLKRFGGR